MENLKNDIWEKIIFAQGEFDDYQTEIKNIKKDVIFYAERNDFNQTIKESLKAIEV